MSVYGYLEVGREIPDEIQNTNRVASMDPNRRREVRMYIVLCISENRSSDPTVSTPKATEGTVRATVNLRQGRLMADHGGLYSNARLLYMGAREGQGGMRARCFSCCKGGKGLCVGEWLSALNLLRLRLTRLWA